MMHLAFLELADAVISKTFRTRILKAQSAIAADMCGSNTMDGGAAIHARMRVGGKLLGGDGGTARASAKRTFLLACRHR